MDASDRVPLLRTRLQFCLSRWITALAAVMVLVISSEVAAQPNETFAAIDDAVQERVNEFYASWSKKSALVRSDLQATATDPSPLSDHSLESGHWARAQLDALQKEADEDRLLQALELLYSVNDTAGVQALTDHINRKPLRKAQAGNYLLLARYYEARQNWPGVVAAIKRIDPAQLPAEDRSYIVLLQGYALQAQKKHRLAADLYQQIEKNSPYFVYARLNEGTAYLRQGWWSEAFHQFNEAINAPGISSELRNRVLVTLGYAQIHHEFYRNARETLRQVSLESAYTEKALLGLGLAAAHQQDLRAALQLFLRLTSSSRIDANVDESHLLVPHVYEELAERDNATVAYGRAIKFYEQRLAQLAAAERRLKQAEVDLSLLLAEFSGRAGELYMAGDPLPRYMLSNYKLLLAMRQQANEVGITVPVQDLISQIEEAFRTQLAHTLAHRRQALESYLSQAKYGLATLYDSP